MAGGLPHGARFSLTANSNILLHQLARTEFEAKPKPTKDTDADIRLQ